uniref:Uncharacterized protein n=1 Tax=Arundo donax TaxID=35708 RepID=A0A0A8Y534_ARUDO
MKRNIRSELNMVRFQNHNVAKHSLSSSPMKESNSHSASKCLSTLVVYSIVVDLCVMVVSATFTQCSDHSLAES